MRKNTYFGTPAAEMTAAVAAEKARLAKLNSDRYDRGCEDDSFLSQKCESICLGEMEEAAELAEMGWRMGFVGLRRVDGTPARGRWIKSKFYGKQDSWGTPKVDGRGLDFISGDLIYKSRTGDQKACDKLRALGFEWVTCRTYVNSRTVYPNTRGLEGLYFAHTNRFACDKDGNEVCADALYYPAESFFVDEAAEVVQQMRWASEAA